MRFLSGNFIKFIIASCVVFISVSSIACNLADKTNFTKADFEKLRWLEGTWRGTDTDGKNQFYERYRPVDEAKIETESFSDAALSEIDRRSITYLENGSIYHRDGDLLWTATKLDDSTIEFAPKEKAAHSFRWKKESADVWTATMSAKDAHGSTHETVYRLERIK
ncbi:MAG TPA: hypothetical protein VF721_05960 [Pyrinomonadaceae bacterium]